MSKFTPKVLRRVTDDIRSQRLKRDELAFMLQETDDLYNVVENLWKESE